MARTIKEPVVTESSHSGKVLSHPAYGQIHAARVQGKVVLAGTDFVHNAFVKITVHRSQLNRLLSRDRWQPTEDLVELYMSEAQWATFVSSMNIGTGVPCTLTRTEGTGYLPALPHRTTVSEFHTETQETLKDAVRELDEALAEKSLPKRVRDHLTKARQEIVSNLPFVEQSFSAHVETAVEHAKVEVNAYVQSVVSRAGITTLAKPPIELIEDKS